MNAARESRTRSRFALRKLCRVSAPEKSSPESSMLGILHYGAVICYFRIGNKLAKSSVHKEKLTAFVRGFSAAAQMVGARMRSWLRESRTQVEG